MDLGWHKAKITSRDELIIREFPHWSIENTCHWSLDVTYREDESRTRHRHLRENLAWLYRFTLSLLKQHPGRDSLAMKRRSCGWNENFLLEVLIGATC